MCSRPIALPCKVVYDNSRGCQSGDGSSRGGGSVFEEHVAEGFGFDRLDEVVVEAGLAGAAGGRPPGPSRSGRRAGSRELGPLPGAAGRPRSRPCRACRCPAGRPRAGTPRRSRGPRGRRGRPALPGRKTSSAAGQARRPRRRCRPRRGRGGGGAAGSAIGGRRPVVRPFEVATAHDGRAGRRTRCPVPGPSLWAATLPPCISTSVLTRLSPIPSPPWARLERSLGLDEHLEDPGQHLGLDADARCRAPGRPTSPPSGSTDRRISPPGSVYLAALFSRFQKTCSSRVGSASSEDRACRAARRSARGRARRSRAGRSRRPAGRPRPGRRPACAARSCPG